MTKGRTEYMAIPSPTTRALGVIKFKILIIITIYLVCLIDAQE